MGFGRFLPSSVKNLLRRCARRAAAVRYTWFWPIARPFYRVAKRFFDIDAIAGVKREDDADIERLKIEKKHLNRVRDYSKRLHLGFEENGVRELDWYVNGPVALPARVKAAWQIAHWYIGRGGAGNASKAQPYLELLAELENTIVDPTLVAAFRTEALLRLSRWDAARDLCMGTIAVTSNSIMKICAANLFADQDLSIFSSEERERVQLNWINALLSGSKLDKLYLREKTKPLSIHNVAGPAELPGPGSDRALVSVIVPAWNEEAFIETGLRSLLNQTWRNIEIIVVDDGSDDKTADVARRFADRDKRIRLIGNESNRGESFAVNLGLAEARGDFVTWHDAHDFAHPRKIELQAEYLLNNGDKIAVRAPQIGVSSGMKLDIGDVNLSGRFGASHPMFRRKQVIKKVGYLDCVRFIGEDEFRHRLKKVFGKDRIGNLKSGLLTFAYREDSSALRLPSGENGCLCGARREYGESFRYWHGNEDDLHVDFLQGKRPFAVPKVLESERLDGNEADTNHYDVIYASDFRLPGGTTASTIEELLAQSALGIKTGMVRLDWFRARPTREMNPKFRALLDSGAATLITYPEEAEADLVILPFPPPIIEPSLWTPKITAKDVRIICNQPPVRGEGELAERMYYAKDVDRRVEEVFGVRGVWHPIGPVPRHSLEAEEGDLIISDEDWFRIIDVNEWTDNREGPVNRIPVIGRHGRDYFDKWPENAELIGQIYPERDDIKVSILGGADVPIKMLGRKPKNWTVYPFDSIHPREYLKKLDVFVYFPDARRFEAFGRTVFEAMAVGVPALLPESFKETFGDAALYCEPGEVVGAVKKLCSDRDMYRERVRIGRECVNERFGYSIHRDRLEKILGRKLGKYAKTTDAGS